jgi:hypothetical protein
VCGLSFFSEYCSVQLQSSLEIAIQFENLIWSQVPPVILT